MADFRARIKAADGLLIATPEYNYSTSGVLKNAIDWASRPPEHPFEGKPIGLMGASAGTLGTARAQYHLRQMFVFLNGFVMNRPEVMIPAAQSKFDAEGELTDQQTRDFMSAHLVAFEGLGAADAMNARTTSRRVGNCSNPSTREFAMTGAGSAIGLVVLAVRHHVGCRRHAV